MGRGAVFFLACFALFGSSNSSFAEQIIKPHTFTAGTPASAEQVNADFDTVYDQVNTLGGAISVDKVGQVGIGTAAPAEKLEVTGRIKGESLQLTVGAADGYFLVTDAAGVAHWQKVEANADNDPANELQIISRSGNDLILSKNGGTVSIADDDSSPTNELQTLSLIGSNLTLSNGNTVNIADGDTSSTNEIQILSVVGANLVLSNGGGTVPFNDGNPTNELNDSVTMTGSTLAVTDGGGSKSVNLAETLGIDNLSDAKYSGANYSLFLGNGVGSANTFGAFNTAVGVSSLYRNTTGNYNTAVGSDALSNNTTGSNNIVIGSLADQYNQTGANNTIIGYQAGRGTSLHSKSGNVFIGNQVGYDETGSNKLYIDNWGTPTPLLYGDFAANALTVNGTLNSTGTLTASGNATVAGTSTLTTLAVTGNSTLAGTLDVNGNGAIGATTVTSTSTLRVVGDADDVHSGYFVNQDTDATSYGVYAVATGVTDRTNDHHYGVYGGASGGNFNYALRGYASDFGATTNYGVYAYAGGGTNNYAGYFEGDARVTGTLYLSVNPVVSSDARLKDNIKPVENALEKVAAINGVYYNMIDNPDETEVGVIAQDVEKVLPEAVRVIDKENGYLGVSYPSLIPVLIEAVKELKAENDAKDMTIASLVALVCQDHPEAGICK